MVEVLPALSGAAFTFLTGFGSFHRCWLASGIIRTENEKERKKMMNTGSVKLGFMLIFNGAISNLYTLPT